MSYAIIGNGMLGKEFCAVIPSGINLVRGECNFLNLEEIYYFLNDNRIDWIINCIAYTKVDKAEEEYDKAFEANVLIPKNLAIIANRIGAGICHFSTDYIFDGKSKIPYQENSKVNPINKYGKTKLLGEYEIRGIAKKYLILRISWLYGLFGVCFPVSIIKKLLNTSNDIFVVDDQLGSPTYTYDVVLNSIYLMENNFTGIYNLTNSGETTWYGFAKEISKFFGFHNRVFPIKSSNLNLPANRPSYSVLDTTKFQKDTGQKPQHWKFALKHFFDQGKIGEG